ncbi:MAG TPA: hypothetical protein VMO26_25190 [Vicinamibacterales bacterium]|nr:hypothetical protein [Vicinamibacterales bacterium]
MMKAILGSALGGLVAGGIALVASAQGRAPEAAWGPHAQPTSPYAMTVADTPHVNPSASSAVECEPHQEAVLQRSIVAGREVAHVACATRTMPVAAYPQAPVYYAQPGYAQPVAVQPDIVQRPVTRTQAVRPRAQRVVTREAVAPKRSWKKSALVIGGAAGAGAGVGAIAGGKKGALIGAAIGGGSGAVYEAIKRN